VFRFAHLSVEEFFDVTLSTEDSHSEIAQACLSLVCTPKAWGDYDPIVETREGQHEDRHLLLYSAVFWPWHFARAKDSTILDIIWDAFVCETNHQRWWKYFVGNVYASSYDNSVHWQRVSALRAQKNPLLSCVCVFDISRKFLQIIDSCAPPMTDLNALLSTASRFGDLEISRLLIDKGSDVTASDDDGRTPLHQALMGGHEGVARLLIDRGADVTAADNYGWTPLDRASAKGHMGLAQLLIEKGADATAADEYGWTPLHFASMCRHEEVAGLLIDKGADVTVANKKGRTPLHLASKSGTEEVVRLLIEKGSDATAADNDGQTPLFLMESRMPAIAAQLLSDNAVGKGRCSRG